MLFLCLPLCLSVWLPLSLTLTLLLILSLSLSLSLSFSFASLLWRLFRVINSTIQSTFSSVCLCLLLSFIFFCWFPLSSFFLSNKFSIFASHVPFSLFIFFVSLSFSLFGIRFQLENSFCLLLCLHCCPLNVVNGLIIINSSRLVGLHIINPRCSALCNWSVRYQASCHFHRCHFIYRVFYFAAAAADILYRC